MYMDTLRYQHMKQTTVSRSVRHALRQGAPAQGSMNSGIEEASPGHAPRGHGLHKHCRNATRRFRRRHAMACPLLISRRHGRNYACPARSSEIDAQTCGPRAAARHSATHRRCMHLSQLSPASRRLRARPTVRETTAMHAPVLFLSGHACGASGRHGAEATAGAAASTARPRSGSSRPHDRPAAQKGACA